MIDWRPTQAGDVMAVVALLADDDLGRAREAEDPAPYLAAFAAMQAEGNNHLFVGTDSAGAICATYQLTFISGLSRRASRRAQIESVRVAAGLRGQGIGAQLMADAEARARAAGCSLIQLTTDQSRHRAHAFYAGLGYAPSHLGFKKSL